MQSLLDGHRSDTTAAGERLRLPKNVGLGAGPSMSRPWACSSGLSECEGLPPDAAHHSRQSEWSSPPVHPTLPCVAKGVGGEMPIDTLNLAAGQPRARILISGVGNAFVGAPCSGKAAALLMAALFLSTASLREPNSLPRWRHLSCSAATFAVAASISGSTLVSLVVSTPTLFHRAL